MSVSGYNPNDRENQELQSEKFIQPLATPGAEGNYVMCPDCEAVIVNPLQLHGEYNNKEFNLESLRGLQKYHCGKCGSDVSIGKSSASNGRIKLYAFTNYKLCGVKIPTFLAKKSIPLGWNFKKTASAGEPQVDPTIA